MICTGCDEEMRDPGVTTCSANKAVVFFDGSVLPSVPYDNEFVDAEDRADHRCHDCGIKLGGKHHRGCDMERCPKCGDQLISCGCIDGSLSLAEMGRLMKPGQSEDEFEAAVKEASDAKRARILAEQGKTEADTVIPADNEDEFDMDDDDYEDDDEYPDGEEIEVIVKLTLIQQPGQSVADAVALAIVDPEYHAEHGVVDWDIVKEPA